MGLLTEACVAIDGSKFKAVNNRDKQLHARQEWTDAWRSSRRASRAICSQLDTADRQEPSEALTTKTSTPEGEDREARRSEMQRLAIRKVKQMLATPDQQISLTDPDSRSMATSGRGSGIVGYNVQVAVDTEHHLIVTHEVTNVGLTTGHNFRPSPSGAKATFWKTGEPRCRRRSRLLRRRGDSGVRVEAGITVTLPKPMTSGIEVRRAVRQAGLPSIVPEEDVYICPAGERLAVPLHERGEHGIEVLRRYWTNACRQLRHQAQLHDGQGASDHPMGARACISKRCSAGSTSIRRRCASGARRSSTRLAPSRPGWAPLTS